MKGIVMVSRALCGALGLEAFLLLSFALFLEGKPAPIAPAVLAACAALVLLNLAGVTAIYAMLRKYAAKFAPPGDLGRRRRWRCTIGELLALFTAFTLIQPFERLWMGKDAVGALVYRDGFRSCWSTATCAIADCGGGYGGAFAQSGFRLPRSTSSLPWPASMRWPRGSPSASKRCLPRRAHRGSRS